jgi:tRNA (cmo5U34)-methyltransferase
MTHDWTFDGFGPQFDEHAEKHLPRYHDAHDVIAHVASFVVPDGGHVADLGCSTGRAVQSIAEAIPGRRITAHLYDLDASMLDLAAERMRGVANCVDIRHQHNLLEADSLAHDAADVTLLLWTLQFLPVWSWRSVLELARQHAAEDGLLIIGAKTRLSDARWQEIADGALADWKWSHGVTADEALAKARSLRGVMNVAPVGRLFDVATAAGWFSPAILYRWHAWVLLGAWASPLHESGNER